MIALHCLSFILNTTFMGYIIYINTKLYQKLEDIYKKLNNRPNYINYTEPISEIEIICDNSDVIMSNPNLHQTQKKDYIVL
jgi:hypothetical protein